MTSNSYTLLGKEEKKDYKDQNKSIHLFYAYSISILVKYFLYKNH